MYCYSNTFLYNVILFLSYLSNIETSVERLAEFFFLANMVTLLAEYWLATGTDSSVIG